jgi:SLOG family YspA-like protein
VIAKNSDMVLLHGGTPRGAEKIAARWADARKVSQVVFKPDWTRHAKAAPFKRSDQLLEALPIGVVVFPLRRHTPAGEPAITVRPALLG